MKLQWECQILIKLDYNSRTELEPIHYDERKKKSKIFTDDLFCRKQDRKKDRGLTKLSTVIVSYYVSRVGG